MIKYAKKNNNNINFIEADISKTNILDSFLVTPKTKVVAVGVPYLQISKSIKRIQMDGELFFNQRQKANWFEK